MAKILITSALPYIYSLPHIGNITGSVLPADVVYKYYLMNGDDVIFICGSDQHGTTIELAAIKQGVSAEELAERLHKDIMKAFADFEFTFTHYGKTHSESNKEVVYQVFDALNKNGYILKTESENPYCKNDKRYLPDRFIEGTCPFCKLGPARGDQCNNCGRLLEPKEIIDPHCTICGKKDIEFRKTKHLSLDYAKLQPKIEKFVKESPNNNWSKNAVNKTLSYLKEGLKPIDITRNIKWGFPVPLKGYEDAVFYVWFDAVLGYIGITKEWDSNKWKDYWLSKDTKMIQFLGKDNIQFHTIQWPGILMGSDIGYILPYSIRSSEFLTLGGGLKFSKSEGRGGMDIVKVLKYAPADYWRFMLVYIYPETSDSEFSIPAFVEVINNVLNDKIGNFIHRTLILAKNNKSILNLKSFDMDKEVQAEIKELIDVFKLHMEKSEIREGLRNVVELADVGNKLMNSNEPWAMAKLAPGDTEKKKRLNDVMGMLLTIARDVIMLLYPFTPKASEIGIKYFGISELPKLTYTKERINPNLDADIKPLFSKIDKAALEKLNELAKS